MHCRKLKILTDVFIQLEALIDLPCFVKTKEKERRLIFV